MKNAFSAVWNESTLKFCRWAIRFIYLFISRPAHGITRALSGWAINLFRLATLASRWSDATGASIVIICTSVPQNTQGREQKKTKTWRRRLSLYRNVREVGFPYDKRQRWIKALYCHGNKEHLSAAEEQKGVRCGRKKTGDTWKLLRHRGLPKTAVRPHFLARPTQNCMHVFKLKAFFFFLNICKVGNLLCSPLLINDLLFLIRPSTLRLGEKKINSPPLIITIPKRKKKRLLRRKQKLF